MGSSGGRGYQCRKDLQKLAAMGVIKSLSAGCMIFCIERSGLLVVRLGQTGTAGVAACIVSRISHAARVLRELRMILRSCKSTL